MSARRALITGISGQDGSYLAELLVAKGYDVTGVVRDPDDREIPNLAGVRDRVALVGGDLLEPSTLVDALSAVRPHELYHLAAPTFVPDLVGGPGGHPRRDRRRDRGAARRRPAPGPGDARVRRDVD